MIENQIDKMAGRYGDDIIVGNAMYNAPAKIAISSITCRETGTIIQALKKTVGGVVSNVPAGVESTFKTIPLVLKEGIDWHPFVNDITSIQLTGATDSVTVHHKPLS